MNTLHSIKLSILCPFQSNLEFTFFYPFLIEFKQSDNCAEGQKYIPFWIRPSLIPLSKNASNMYSNFSSWKRLKNLRVLSSSWLSFRVNWGPAKKSWSFRPNIWIFYPYLEWTLCGYLVGFPCLLSSQFPLQLRSNWVVLFFWSLVITRTSLLHTPWAWRSYWSDLF